MMEDIGKHAVEKQSLHDALCILDIHDIRWLTSFACEKWQKRFSDSHTILHFHVVMIKAIFVSPCGMCMYAYVPCGMYPAGIHKNCQVGVYYTLYHCHIEMMNSMTITESLQPLF